MIDGMTIKLGERDYVVPPLNFRLLKKYASEIATMGAITSTADPMGNLSRMVPVITAGLQRNYPDITEEIVEDALDLVNCRKVFEALLGVTPEMHDLLTKRLAEIGVGEAKPLPTTVQ